MTKGSFEKEFERLCSELRESEHIMCVSLLENSQYRSACHMAYNSAVYIDDIVGSVQACTCLDTENAAPTPLSIFEPSVKMHSGCSYSVRIL